MDRLQNKQGRLEAATKSTRHWPREFRQNNRQAKRLAEQLLDQASNYSILNSTMKSNCDSYNSFDLNFLNKHKLLFWE